MKPTLFNAAISLVPGTQVSYNGTTLIWHEYKEPPVTETELSAELQRLITEYEAKEYQRLRAPEYPPITEYIDGVVKGDQAQIDKYIADCLAVKAKYPKVSELN
jgi:hypothetical protein